MVWMNKSVDEKMLWMRDERREEKFKLLPVIQLPGIEVRVLQG